MFQFISRYSFNDIATDLGTANTLVYPKDKEIALDESSVVAIQNTSRGRDVIVVVGTEAKKMQECAPCNIHIVRPMKGGVIMDFDITERMLGPSIRKMVGGGMVVPPHVVTCVPGGSTRVERKIIRDSAFTVSTASVYLTEESMAAVLGAGLPIEDAAGSTVVSIDGGTTEVGVLSLNDLVYSDSTRVGGDTSDEAIVHHLRRNCGVIIGETTAEEVRKKIDTMFEDNKTTAIMVKERSLVESTPELTAITSGETREALSESLSQIIRSVRLTLEFAPPGSAGDITDCGLVLTGGGASLRGMDLLLIDATELPIGITGEPLNCAAHGVGRASDCIGTLNTVFVENM